MTQQGPSGPGEDAECASLPEAVRQRVIALTAEALGRLGNDELPRSLRQVARFAPTKRARLGANAIAACLESDATFRHRVLDQVAPDGDLVAALRQGSVPAAADPVEVAALAYFLRSPGWSSHVAAAVEEARREAAAAGSKRESAVVTRLQEQLSTARTAAREDRERLKAEIDRLKTENSGLRRRLAEARERASGAVSGAGEAAARASDAVAAAEIARSNAEAEARRLRGRLSETEASLVKARRDVREGRGLAAAKLRLLVDSLTDAARGLSQELALPPTELRPADTVEAVEPAPVGPAVGWPADADDPARLDLLLSLPRVHLVIDGYNVTKLQWGDMTLEAQRNRLVQELGAMAARTRAEITCVFDGADLDYPPTVASPRGVRVRFSLPGQTADELIRQLVRAEPKGRQVVVVSSDREIQQGVRRPGVHAVPSLALVRLVSR